MFHKWKFPSQDSFTFKRQILVLFHAKMSSLNIIFHHMSVSRGSAPRLNFMNPDPPRLLEWLMLRGAVRFSPFSSSFPLGPSKLVSRIWPMDLDLNLTLSAVSILALTSSSSKEVSRSLEEDSAGPLDDQGGGGELGGGGRVPLLPMVMWAKGLA